MIWLSLSYYYGLVSMIGLVIVFLISKIWLMNEYRDFPFPSSRIVILFLIYRFAFSLSLQSPLVLFLNFLVYNMSKSFFFALSSAIF